MSVADRGRGGFDSHTFPPLRARARNLVLAGALVLGAVMGARAAAAQETGPDSARVAPPVPDAAAAPKPARPVGERQRPWHRTPTAIMFRSTLVPGWGQWVNHRPIKAVAALAVEGFAGVNLVRSWQDVDAALAARDAALAAGDVEAANAAQAEYDQAFNRRATAGWILGIAIATSMLDAYVDAHLIQFDADFGKDPALPATATSYRLSLNVSFTGP